MDNELSPLGTETILAYPRWYTNGTRWYTAWRADGEVKAFLMPNEEPTVSETEKNWDAGVDCEPFNNETIREMVAYEAMVRYYATGDDIGFVVLEFGIPNSDEMGREEFDVYLFISDGEPVGVEVSPVSDRMKALWEE